MTQRYLCPNGPCPDELLEELADFLEQPVDKADVKAFHMMLGEVEDAIEGVTDSKRPKLNEAMSYIGRIFFNMTMDHVDVRYEETGESRLLGVTIPAEPNDRGIEFIVKIDPKVEDDTDLRVPDRALSTQLHEGIHVWLDTKGCPGQEEGVCSNESYERWAKQLGDPPNHGDVFCRAAKRIEDHCRALQLWNCNMTREVDLEIWWEEDDQMELEDHEDTINFCWPDQTVRREGKKFIWSKRERIPRTQDQFRLAIQEQSDGIIRPWPAADASDPSYRAEGYPMPQAPMSGRRGRSPARSG